VEGGKFIYREGEGVEDPLKDGVQDLKGEIHGKRI